MTICQLLKFYYFEFEKLHFRIANELVAVLIDVFKLRLGASIAWSVGRSFRLSVLAKSLISDWLRNFAR